MAIQQESLLYAPVKALFESLGYEVKGEVLACDLVARKEDETEPVIVELKKTFSLPLVYQGLDRLKLSDTVYVAVEAPGGRSKALAKKQRDMVTLCRRIGLGLITVRFPAKRKPVVDVLCHPAPYAPRKSNVRVQKLIREFEARTGDYNTGGTTKQKRMTAYREKAIACAYWLHQKGPLRPRDLRDLTGEARAGRLLRDNHYGWFAPVSKGVYAITERGVEALAEHAPIIREWFPESSS